MKTAGDRLVTCAFVRVIYYVNNLGSLIQCLPYHCHLEILDIGLMPPKS